MNESPGRLLLGFFYFSGWAKGAGGGPPQCVADPWLPIPPERWALGIGRYDDANQQDFDQHLVWMRDAGADFICIEYYLQAGPAAGSLAPYLDAALRSYQASQVEGKPKLCLMWCADTNVEIYSAANWMDVFATMSPHFDSPDYFRHNGAPVVFIFEAQALNDRVFGSPEATAAALDEARRACYPLGGVRFVMLTADGGNYWKDVVERMRADAVTIYTSFFRNIAGQDQQVVPTETGFGRLTSAAMGDDEAVAPAGAIARVSRSWWNSWTASKVPGVWMSAQSGWDNTPWLPIGQLADVLAEPTDDEFQAAAVKALGLAAAHPKSGVCMFIWNEHGEGQMTVPTQGDQGARLKAVAAGVAQLRSVTYTGTTDDGRAFRIDLQPKA